MMKRTVLAVLIAGALSIGGGIVSGMHGIALAFEGPAQIVTYVPPGPFAVFRAATVSYRDYISGATVQIGSGLVPSEDRLHLQYYGGAPIVASYNAATGTLTITGRATGTEWGRILSSVFYSNTAVDPNNRDRVIVARLGSARYLQATGHYYDLVRPEQPLSWSAASADASLRYHLGLRGYLVTITSQAEQSFVASLAVGASFWLGANASSANTWRWMTGPEGSQAGGTGLAFYDTSGPIAGRYSNWSSGYLAQAQSKTANFVAMSANGQWARFVHGAATGGYVVEYGGLGATPAFFDRFSTTIHVLVRR